MRSQWKGGGRQGTVKFLWGLFLLLSAPAPGEVTAETFRDLFLGALPHPVTRDEATFPVYLAPEELFRAPAGATADALLSSLTARFRDVVPTSLYQHGARRRASPVAREKLVRLLVERPITLVIVPGIFSEFIETRSFEEVFADERSAFHVQYRRALAAANGSADTRDHHFSLSRLGDVDAPLADLVNAASLDVDGKPVVRLVLFRTPRLSLETLRTPRDNSEEFVRRLGKFFRVLGETPENLVLVGYSRGTPVALDMLSLAEERGLEWLSRVRGMVALGGVTFGSDLADETRRPGTPARETMRLVRALRRELHPVPEGAGWWDTTTTVAANLDAFRRFGWGLAQAGSDPSLLRPLATMILSTFRRGEETDVLETAQIGMALAREFGLTKFVSGYSENIVRFQRFLDEVLVAVDGLTTEDRRAWWSHHTVPTVGIRYYAVGGTMVDPNDDAALAGNTICYDRKLFDYKMLLQNYRDFRRASGLAVNDSQVALHKVAFWPELIERLNPRQAPIASTFLGVVGTHHWGLALPIVTKMRASEARDPFPRKALLQAISASVALDLGGTL